MSPQTRPKGQGSFCRLHKATNRSTTAPPVIRRSPATRASWCCKWRQRDWCGSDDGDFRLRRLRGNPEAETSLDTNNFLWRVCDCSDVRSERNSLAFLRALGRCVWSVSGTHVWRGNVCRAELDGVEVAQARRAGAAGTNPFFWSVSGGRRA